jgi:O-acetyl-ADP-ribose deacetylase (regulator of RNase III)
MLKYHEGTIFNTPVKTLVNTVNCFGVMGAGIALEFKLRYPDMFEEYKKMCEEKKYFVGKPRLHKSNNENFILNFPTKNHWRYPSKMQWIEEGLQYFVNNYKRAGIESIAFPKLGTNNGGLEWKDVKEVMEKYLSNLDIDVYICLDEKKEAEGIEKEMVDSINEANIEKLVNEVKLTKKQVDKIMEYIPIKRFWHLSKVKGLGEKTYQKVFQYYYNISTNKDKESDDRFKEVQCEQISFFSGIF